ncbi:UV-damage endonuclease [Magnaporthiopsis poae ATCC 64411]|uniref:UV-damage endonuclease n=1 Tax=Magnaporthiopsis poae (strain ATCC 64411 / 73-15) TaxID=644358 RepID=A0A0C4EC09_MAGP6|nr:UV-damage endonuclease [Magnaporthiopsis poae ATCC 64411]
MGAWLLSHCPRVHCCAPAALAAHSWSGSRHPGLDRRPSNIINSQKVVAVSTCNVAALPHPLLVPGDGIASVSFSSSLPTGSSETVLRKYLALFIPPQSHRRSTTAGATRLLSPRLPSLYQGRFAMVARPKSGAADGGHRGTNGNTGPNPPISSGPVASTTVTECTLATPSRRSTRLARTEGTPGQAPSHTTTTGSNGDPTIRVREEQAGMAVNQGILAAPASPQSNTTASDGEVHGQESDNAKGVQDALEGLAQMEERLQRMTKRQRRKVEESKNTVLTVQPRQGRRSDDSREESPATRGRMAQMSIKAEASAAAAPGDSMPDDRHVHFSNKKGAVDSNRSGEEPIRKPTAVANPADRGAARAPPVDSDYLPLPWKGRLGYACLNTYLRSGRTPVFSSRTCRMASIIDHRYPLIDPTQPEHPTKNRPDKSKEPDNARGLKFIQDLGVANARDIVKMVRWNERYGIRFMRLSSEMFPFASHHEHGYRLAPFASEVLAEAGKVAAEFGHRLTTHPGQFTQLGSPRPEVVTASVRDLEYHDEMLTLLKLPEQLDRDAVMILHLGGVYGDKSATLDRFRYNYKTLLSESIKRRLVLENDDTSWSVHDLLPLCEELNIPLVLDFHHHNIVFDPDKCREGTADLVPLIPRIRKTWERKKITMKMHYSEPCAGAITPRDRRKHSPRVATLPPCPADMDLMIEAKDKEQAVFELMRNFRLPGYDRISCMIPHERVDEPEPDRSSASVRAGNAAKKKKAVGGGRRKKSDEKGEQKSSADDATKQEEEDDGGTQEAVQPRRQIPDEEIGMGGPEGRVYWPPGMEAWLRPLKRDQKRKFETLEGYEDVEDADVYDSI